MTNSLGMLNEAPLDKKTGKFITSWQLFFKSLFQGDNGTALNLTPHVMTGTATITGACYRLSSKLYFVRIKITPTTPITLTAGTTFLSGFPFDCTARGCIPVMADINSIGVAVTDPGGSLGAFFFLPSYTGSDPVILQGTVEAQ